MNFISVCSGIEAASVAFAPLGWKAIAFSEIEPFPRAVLAHHYPDVPNFGDMSRFREWPQEIFANADAVVGGPPCQAFSVAGARSGLNDDRGNLTLIYAELINHADAIRARNGKPPVIVLYENVPGLLSDKTGAFGCFLGRLAGEDCALEPPGGRWADAGCVYGPKRAIAWRVLDAQFFGLAQRRRRVFVVASARDGFDPAEVIFEFDGLRRDFAPSRKPGKDTSGSTGDGIARCLTTGEMKRQDWETCTMVAQPVAFDTTQVTSAANYSSPKPGDPCHPLAAGAHPPVIAFSAKDYGADAGELAPTLRAMGHTSSHANGGGQVAIAVRTAQTGSNGWGINTEGFGASEDRTGRGAGAVAVALRGRDGGATADVGDECAFTLRAITGGGDKPHALTSMAVVRRLTPRECEALQGFPQDYTAIPWRKNPASECPDGPRYKALGNSWAVPVVRWIGVRINQHMKGKK